jgi:hypothetical protein
MPDKIFQTPKSGPTTVNEPVAVYDRNTAHTVAASEISASNRWNPNVPFHGTQEEWWEHFHQIEAGNFTPLEEANKEFEAWKKEYLANRLK